MANHGAGAKFLSVNLNKSYGQTLQNPNLSSYGTSRTRSAGGGGGGGMVVLSRSRGAQKPGTKLSVPAPLNLPSLRKEHERLDSSGNGGGGAAGGGGNSGVGSRPTSSGMGWTKPVVAAVGNSDRNSESQIVGVDSGVDGGSRGTGGVYMPPIGRPIGTGLPVNNGPGQGLVQVQKVAVLRGEDFPSLRATLSSGVSSFDKQKDDPSQRQKQSAREGVPDERLDGTSRFSSVVQNPPVQSSHQILGQSTHNHYEGHGPADARGNERDRKHVDLFDPLPLVRLNPRSDWADDERDTGHGLVDRGRDYGVSKSDAYWDQDFDMRRSSFLPHKPGYSMFDRQVLRDNEAGKFSSSEVLSVDPYVMDARAPGVENREGSSWRYSMSHERDIRTPSREGKEVNTWRNSSAPKVGFGAQGISGNINGVSAGNSGLIRETSKDSKFVSAAFRESSERNVSGAVSQNRDTPVRGNARYEQEGRLHSNNFGDLTIRPEQSVRDRNGSEQYNRYRSNNLQFNSPAKSTFSLGVKGLPMNDPLLNFGRDKKSFSKREKPSIEDPFGGTGFDEHDPFTGALVGVVKRKKEVLNPMDFHDPARESFEAELERVQKMQEQERQRIIEEQERALELAQREEEERLCLAREREEHQRKLEDEAREAAWRAEQEQLEAIRKTEEQRIAREEEKRRIEMEEERRKQAAKQKLIELEEKIAKRQAEAANSDNFSSPAVATSDRAFPQNDIHRDLGLVSSTNHSIGGITEPQMGEVARFKGQRWNLLGDADQYRRNADMKSEFHENLDGRLGDFGWEKSNSQPPYTDQLYENPDVDDIYSYGRSRYSVRQPRVLPPPSLVSIHKLSNRRETDHNSSFLLSENDPISETRREPPLQPKYGGSQENSEQSGMSNGLQDDAETEEQKLYSDNQLRCDSQSSFSSSSPPCSPTHLSHVDLDETGNSRVLSSAEGKDGHVSENGPALITTQSCVSTGDDEESSIENNDQLQEQEEYDQVGDYQDVDEIHEGDEENIDLNEEFENLHLEHRGSPQLTDNMVLGFNEGVEIVISGEQHGTFDLHGEGENFLDVDGSLQDDICKSGVRESEMAVMDPAIEPTDGLHTYTSPDVLSSVDVSNGFGQSPLTSTAPSSFQTAESSSAQTLASTLTTVPSPAEIPFKLQFGLFSGPSLIPSPVPSIQIGSIQMPLHLHPQVGPSLSHVHPSQAPLFQFGQLRYSPPISEGLFPMAPPMGFIQPNLPAQYLANQNLGIPNAMQPNHNYVKHDMVPPSVENQPGIISRPIELSQDVDSLRVARSEQSIIDGREADSDSADNGNIHDKREPDGTSGSWSPDPVARERVMIASRAPGPVSGGRGKRIVPNAKNAGSRSQFLVTGAARIDSGFHRKPRRGVQRIEFRVRENSNKKESLGWVASNHLGEDDRLSFNGNGKEIGTSARTEAKRGVTLFKQSKQNNVSESPTVIGSKEISSTSKTGSQTGKGAGQSMLRTGEGSLKRNIEEGVDAPLQSGIVRIYEQPGIEAPSDEDDFIEVRSKRQMLNDRREQKEKEIKAKSRLAKNVQNRRSTSQNTRVSSSSNRNYSFSSAASQILSPIGTPAVNSDTQLDIGMQTTKSHQPSSVSFISSSSKDLGSGPSFESKVLDDVQTSLGAWTNSRVGKQVMPLTQSQLDEAMKPGRFDSRVSSSIGDCSIGVLDMSSSSILPKEKPFSSSASPINSLLAGEKIQFGAVTSPTVLPSNSRGITKGIGPPGSCRSDIQISHNLATSENTCTIFFEKGNKASDSRPHLEDPEDEAEAAASAVAVAAITSDEIIGSGLGKNSISMSDSKSFGVDISEISSGVNGDQKPATPLRTEESLSLSLPADLSVETPPTSVWQPLQSPQHSTSQMISHFPGAPPCHFPYYEMNPMLGGPIFAFGPQDESTGGNQSHSQKNNAPVSAPVGTWQQYNSGVDSFHGPPAGFTGPFVSPPGGIPGFQGPPHMVVYNHFASVGQFGQVGLNYVGTTYIPSGKQPDWKHNPSSSSMGMSEGNMINPSMVSGQRNLPNLPTPIQHLAPGAPLMPLASPMAMFDASPFQSSLDMANSARWSHLPASSISSLNSQLTLQQQAESVIPSQFTHGPTVDQSLIESNRFSNSRSTAPSDGSKSISIPSAASVAHFSEALGLMEPSTSTTIEGSVPGVAPGGDAGIKDVGSSSNANGRGTTSGHKTYPSQQTSVNSQQQGQSGGYNYPRGGVFSQKNGTGGKWSNRVMSFHGRNRSLGQEKNFHSSKVKQIYVAKQPSGGTSSAV